jgi:hypothetical protein
MLFGASKHNVECGESIILLGNAVKEHIKATDGALVSIRTLLPEVSAGADYSDEQ